MGIVILTLLVSFRPGVPTAAWFVEKDNPVRIRVVDKTVPHPNYREHAALFWVLNHEKTQPPDFERPWTLDRDYVGYYPDPDEKCYGSYIPLDEDYLTEIDLLYIADAYGVYTLDMVGCSELKAALDYSKVIKGGFTLDEVKVIEAFAERGGMVIGEFNTFASPTHGEPRERLENLFGVRWTRWAGRYFEELSSIDDVPVWARRNWLKQYGVPWRFKGPGFLLVHEDERLFVLESPSEAAVEGMKIRNLEMFDQVLMGTKNDTPFLYWFDIVEALPETEVLAEYELEVTAKGLRELRKFGVPARFPAVSRVSRSPLRVYLAGDMSDARVPVAPYYWADWFKAVRTALIKSDDEYQRVFMWESYFPLEANLLDIARASLGY